MEANNDNVESGAVDNVQGEGQELNTFTTCGCGRPTRYMVGRADLYACNKYFRCMTYEEQGNRIQQLHRALHDAINSPKGVVPDSAQNLYDSRMFGLHPEAGEPRADPVELKD